MVADNINAVIVGTLFPLALVCVFQLIRSYQSGISGPFLARFTRLWLFKEAYYGTFHLTNLKLHRAYGPIVRIRPNEYSIDDPSVVRSIYGAGSSFTKSDWYSAFASPAFEHLNLFTLRDAKVHSALRRQMSIFYSQSYLTKYESFVDNNTRTLCTRLQEFAQEKKVFNLGHWLQCYAFDVITEITFGQPFGFLERGDDVENLIATMERIQAWGTRYGLFPTLHYILATYFGVDVGKSMPVFAIKRIIQREQAGKPDTLTLTKDFLTIFLDLHRQNPDEFTKEVVVAACTQNIAAGSDTTGISLTAALYNFVKEPSATKKLLNEVEAAYPSRGRGNHLSFKEAQDLKYLQAAIKETLRLHPATGMPLARRVPKGGATLANHYFPEGAVVGVNTWVAHRNENVFGKDSAIFRPTRWLEADKEALSSMERYFIPFGAGSRTCIGKNISLLEMSKVIPVLLSNFEFHLEGDWQKEFETSACDWFVKPRALPVSVKLRS